MPSFEDLKVVKIYQSELVIKDKVLHCNQEYDSDEGGDLFYRNRRRDILLKSIVSIETSYVQAEDFWQITVFVCGAGDLILRTKTQTRADAIHSFIFKHVPR